MVAFLAPKQMCMMIALEREYRCGYTWLHRELIVLGALPTGCILLHPLGTVASFHPNKPNVDQIKGASLGTAIVPFLGGSLSNVEVVSSQIYFGFDKVS